MLDIKTKNSLKHGDSDAYRELRRKMIQRQIVARGVVDPLVIKAIENVPRHRFVDERLEKLAYDDSPLPIGDNQTISQPFIVAYMTAALELKGGEKVLEVGTGSGYQAAVLAELADQVYTIEVNENLAIEVAGRLKKLGYYNVSLKCDNGYQGWPEYAPFDGIIVTAAPDHIPEPLLEQLKPGKKMIIPVGQASQELLVVSKQSDGSIRKEARIAVRFVPMIDETENRD